MTFSKAASPSDCRTSQRSCGFGTQLACRERISLSAPGPDSEYFAREFYTARQRPDLKFLISDICPGPMSGGLAPLKLSGRQCSCYTEKISSLGAWLAVYASRCT
ncbi:hypothetical protein FGB62_286g010 [Gracilaria domingensis]|nr:hypothetical protein FGB62_286g010 [Gracilaria domingensis]